MLSLRYIQEIYTEEINRTIIDIMKNEKCEVIAYWLMGKKFCNSVINDYKNIDTIIQAIKEIEDDPTCPNVGRFSHPNENGELQLDAAYMEGDGKVGAVIETSHIVNPIEVAYSLSKFNKNIVLASSGADAYAIKNGFKTKEKLEICEEDKEQLSHDTFGVIQLIDGHFKVLITTSGTKGKTLGRVGDTPLVGSGFYCEDGCGACVATGDGEACLRSVMAKEVVDRLAFGESIEGICKRVLDKGLAKLDYKATLSLVAVDKDGHFNSASTFEVFPFSFINKGIIYNRYLYQDKEYEEDDRLQKLYHGD